MARWILTYNETLSNGGIVKRTEQYLTKIGALLVVKINGIKGATLTKYRD